MIARVDVHDEDAYAREYRAHVLPTVERHGGRFLVRGGPFDVLEGEWPESRIVVLEFPSVDDARRWYESGDYQPLADIRKRLTKSHLLLIEGA